MAFWDRRKPVDMVAEIDPSHRLKATLSWPHLVALGVGAIVGTGIYTLIGVGAGLAGPAVILSFVIAGVICICAGLAYAEMSTMIPAAGSAYTYSYAVLGEMLAWVVGWSLMLEYTVVCSAVAVGWAGHVVPFIQAAGIPEVLLKGPEQGGLINLPAVIICFVVAGLLLVGTRESANVNLVLVVIKVLALAAFVAIAAPHFDASHFTPFMPKGFEGHAADGTGLGVMGAAAIIFFAFYGFDAVATAAEETRNPARDLTIGIVGSMLICVAIYMGVAAAAIGAVRTEVFASHDAPLVYILEILKQPVTAKVVAGAAVVALPTVILAFMYGQSRIFFVMARDGLLPSVFARLHKKFRTPWIGTLLLGSAIAVAAGLLPITILGDLVSLGTATAFAIVCISVMYLRSQRPDLERPFKVPGGGFWIGKAWIGVVPVLGILACGVLAYPLIADIIIKATHGDAIPAILLCSYLAIGAVIYLSYGLWNSRLAKGLDILEVGQGPVDAIAHGVEK